MKKNKAVYVAGTLLGVLAIVSAIATTKILDKTHYLGASTTFVRAAGLIEELFSADVSSSITYYAKQKIKVDWQFMLVVGIAIGSFISSMLNRSFKLELVPPLWRERFGGSVMKRFAGAFAGGILAMYGARLADGCPSGHGLSGMMQLSLSSFVALFLFVAVGAVVARIIYGGRVK